MLARWPLKSRSHQDCSLSLESRILFSEGAHNSGDDSRARIIKAGHWSTIH